MHEAAAAVVIGLLQVGQVFTVAGDAGPFQPPVDGNEARCEVARDEGLSKEVQVRGVLQLAVYGLQRGGKREDVETRIQKNRIYQPSSRTGQFVAALWLLNYTTPTLCNNLCYFNQPSINRAV